MLEAPVARADDVGGLLAQEDVDRPRVASLEPPATQRSKAAARVTMPVRQHNGIDPGQALGLDGEVAGHVEEQRRSVRDQERALEPARAALTGGSAAGARAEKGELHAGSMSACASVRLRGKPQRGLRIGTDDRQCGRCESVAMSVAMRPSREELEALVRHYHHVESEHERARPQGSVRRHLELRLDHDRERLEHLLAEHVPEESLRRAWRDFLHHRGGEPSGPPAIRPVVFKGRSDAGSVVEVRRDRSGELAVEVDGQLVERLDVRLVPITQGGPAVFRLDGAEFREVFDAGLVALRALGDFRASGGDPPWEHASALLADGLIDADFALTARGRRALAATRGA